ncbi:MAG: YbaK/EbsC family protein [Gammaproteobacteria bacterium]|nr:YbaK/EbsC family protein [Gammaproteobacteria bacterium]
MKQKEVLNFLDQKKINYKFIQLKRIPQSSQDVVELFGSPLNQVIKTLLFVGDKNIIVCLPGDRKVDVEKLKKLFNVKKLRLAKHDEVEKLTGYQVGGVCPFLLPDNIVSVLDEHALHQEKINIGAGTQTTGIELSPASLKQIWLGKITDISCGNMET